MSTPPKHSSTRRVTLTYALTPPSMNTTSSGYKAHWAVAMRVKKHWQSTWELLLLESGLPKKWRFISVRAVLYFPVERRRDAENYLPSLSKPLADAMVNGGWIPDDTPEHFRFDRVTFARGTKKTVITVEASK